jgi:hypothetical protein
MHEPYIDERFSSSAACLQYLLDHSGPERTDESWLEQPGSQLIVPHRAPRLLFRGEPGLFPSTKPSTWRPENWQGLSIESRSVFNRLSDWLHGTLRALAYGLSDLEALAFLQHYHLPTNILDFTRNPAVAIAFAVASRDSESARIGVLPTASFPHGFSVAELCDHNFADRARRQEGFAVATLAPPILDWKSSWARDYLGIKWYEFHVTARDREFWRKHSDELLCLSTDPTAGLLRLHTIEYVERFGKLPHDLALWTVQKVPMVPLVFHRPCPQERVVELIASGKVSFDESVEREQTLRYLSRDYPDDSRVRVGEWVPPETGDIVTDPRTLHQPIGHPRKSAA